MERTDPITEPGLAGRLGDELRQIREHVADPRHQAARRLGQEVRDLIDRLTATTAPLDVLAEAEARVAEVRALLSDYDSVRHYEGFSEASGVGHDRAFFDWSPLLGLANPLAPPILVDVEEGMIVGRGTFGIAYEGPPGCVHGGYIAAAFDEVLGLAQSLSGQVGMTGTLTVKYRRPTPLHTELRFEAKVDEVNGRKVFTSGQLLAGEALTAEATGLFIATSPEKFAALAPNRERQTGLDGPRPG